MFSIPRLPSPDKLCHLLSFSLLQELYPRDLLVCLLSTYHAWEQRERKLNQVTMISLLIAWSLWTRCSLRRTADRLLSSVRWNHDEPVDPTPSSGAFCYRRKQLGVRVLRALFQHVCQPVAQCETPGCFAFGLRLMGIDGTTFSLAESSHNHHCFRRSTSGSSSKSSPFPLLRAVLLVEIGTHAIVDAIPAMIWATERRLARGVLRSIHQGMLVLLDRGFFSAAFLQQLVQRQAHVLGRLASNCLLQPGRLLSDGSRLITLTPSTSPALHAPLCVRVLSYRIEAKAADQLEQVTPSHSRHGACTTNPDVKQVHRLVTTLLDPDRYRALDLIQLYHERWEVEVTIDELKDHQRLAQNPLVSKSQMLVLQEFYALLLAHYVLRVLMVRAAEQASIDPDRISFTQAIVLVSDAMLLAQGQGCPIGKLVTDLARRDWLLPARRLRFNARVIKRAGWRFQLKRPTHVFLSARDFLSLRGRSQPSFLDLVLLI